MSQKSQLDKFQSRLAKKKMDEEAIRREEILNNTPERKAEEIAKNHGLSTEDIFAVITRNSMGSFIRLWNNSMESVIRNTVRNEVKEIIRNTISQELEGAYRGFMRGISDINSIVQEEIQNTFKDEVEAFVSSEINVASMFKQNDSNSVNSAQDKPEQKASESIQEELKFSDEIEDENNTISEKAKKIQENLSVEQSEIVNDEKHNDDNFINTIKEKKTRGRRAKVNKLEKEQSKSVNKKGNSKRKQYTPPVPKEEFDTYLKNMILDLHSRGLNAELGNMIRKQGGQYSTLFQRFMKEHKGERGAWKIYVNNVLDGNLTIIN